MLKFHSANPETIIVPKDRHRKKFDPTALINLTASIRRIGQLQPGVCTQTKEGIQLVAGERRLRACAEAGKEFIYLLLEEIDDPILLEEIELEENLLREDLTWQEEILAKERLHRIKQERKGGTSPGKRGGHTMEDTARELGETKGLVSKDIELAYFVKFSEEVAKARNKTEAKKIVQRIKDTAERTRLLKESLAKKKEEGGQKDSGGETTAQIPDAQILLSKRLQMLKPRCIHGTFEEKIKAFEDGTFDVVIFDPPWGVDFDEVSEGTEYEGHLQRYKDKKDEVLKKLPLWLEAIYGKLAENSHLYLIFGIVNYEFIYRLLESVGFSTNGMPLFWHKRGAHRTRNPKVWPGRCYESIAFARKGSKDLVLQGEPDIIETPMPTPKMKKIQPSAKHPELYLKLLQRSCLPGDKVLDPMSGSGMFGVACEQLSITHNLDWYMIEKEKNFVELGLFNLIEGYGKIVQGSAKEEPEVKPWEKYDKWADNLGAKKTKADGFKELTPGTPEWKEWWKTHPEDQEEMLAFARERKANGETNP